MSKPITEDEIRIMLKEKWIKNLLMDRVPRDLQDALFSGKYIVEGKNISVIQRGGSLYGLEIVSYLQYLKDLEDGNDSLLPPHQKNQMPILERAFLLNKVKVLGSQIMELQKIITLQQIEYSKEDTLLQQIQIEEDLIAMNFYKNICEKIARKNQHYTIVIYGKNNESPIGFSQTKLVIDDGNTFPKLSDIKNNPNHRKFIGTFILYENDHVVIYIRGITDPDVYAVIDKLKEENGLD
jgi:hypothetical protein